MVQVTVYPQNPSCIMPHEELEVKRYINTILPEASNSAYNWVIFQVEDEAKLVSVLKLLALEYNVVINITRVEVISNLYNAQRISNGN